MDRCVSGKRCYQTIEIAEDALIESWTRFEFNPGHGPVAIYKCEDCGQYHFTSRGPMNERLSREIKEGKIDRLRTANHWEQKFRQK